MVTAIALVDIDPLDCPAGQCLGFGDYLGQGVPVIGIARQRLGVEHELAALAAVIGGRDRDLAAELVGLMGLAFADALGLGRVPGVELAAALGVMLRADLHRLAPGFVEG